MKMKKTMDKLIKETTELKKQIAIKAIKEGDLSDFDSDVLDMLVRINKLVDYAMELSVQYVDCIEEQNKKLDILLERTKKLEES